MKKKIIFSISIILVFFIGVIIGSIYGGITQNTVLDCIEGNIDNQNSSTGEQQSKEGTTDEKSIYNHLEDAVEMSNLINAFSWPGVLSLNDWAKELYGKEKTIIQDVDKKILYYVTYTYLHDRGLIPYIKYENGSGSNDETTYNADKYKEEVIRRFGMYFNKKSISNDDVAFLTEASSKDKLCPLISYNKKQNTYMISSACGGFAFPPEIYKYDFTGEDYIAYGTIKAFSATESHGGTLTENIDGNYKYTFKKNDLDGSGQNGNGYNLYLYSIEKVK